MKAIEVTGTLDEKGQLFLAHPIGAKTREDTVGESNHLVTYGNT